MRLASIELMLTWTRKKLYNYKNSVMISREYQYCCTIYINNGFDRERVSML